MKVTSKFIKESGKRYHISSDCDLLVRDFVSQLCDIVKVERPLYFYDIDSFMNALHYGGAGSGIFGSEDTNKVLVLLNFSKEHVDIIEPVVDIDTEDYILLVESQHILKTKAYTKIKGAFRNVKIEAPKEQACRTLVRKELIAQKVDFHDDVPETIVNIHGAYIQSLLNEVKKIKLAFQGHKVSSADCKSIVAEDYEVQMFTFMENFFRRRVVQTLEEFNKINETMYVNLIHFMVSQVERVYQVAIYKEAGHNQQDIADLMGLPLFILKTKYFTVLASYSKMKLVQLLDLLNEANYRLRSCSLSKKLVIESYILRGLRL